MAPVRGTKPKVGRRPVTPQRVEGEEMEPSVSEPMEKRDASGGSGATPGRRKSRWSPGGGFQGLRVRPPNHLSPMASAPSVSFATRTAPAASRRWTTVASSSKL